MHHTCVRRTLLAVLALLALALPASASADRLVIPGGPTFTATGIETAVVGGYVYFAADDGVHGTELWRTDGTAAGTTLVQDINVGNASSSSGPSNFFVAGDRLFFKVFNDGAGISNVIYTLDPGGTPQRPTLPTTEGVPAGTVARGTVFGVVNGKAVITSYQGGTYRVYALGDTGNVFTQVSSGEFGADAFNSQNNSATVGGFVYFAGNAAAITGGGVGNELYRTDGTSAPTLVKNISPESGGQVYSGNPSGFTATSNRVYFSANDGFHGSELWVTDGTDPGTHLVRDHQPGPASGTVDSRTAIGNTLYYVTDDATTGPEVWRTDGTDAGTRVVKDLTPGMGGSGPLQVFAVGGGLGFFNSGDVYGSDGTDAGTRLVATTSGDGSGPLYPTTVGARAYFRAGAGRYGSSVWRTDGTAAGTFALTSGAFDATTGGNPDVGPVTQLGSKLIFTGRYPEDQTSSLRRVYVIDMDQPDGPRLGEQPTPPGPQPPAPGTGETRGPSVPSSPPSGAAREKAQVAKLSAVKLAKRRFSRRTGTKLSFKLDRASRVTVTLRRKASGRRKGKSCSTKARRGKRCTAYVKAKTTRIKARKGRTRITYGKKLRRGTYIARVSVKGGRRVTLRFTVR